MYLFIFILCQKQASIYKVTFVSAVDISADYIMQTADVKTSIRNVKVFVSL